MTVIMAYGFHHVNKHVGFVQRVEYRADYDKHEQYRDKRQRAAAAKHQKRRKQYFPPGKPPKRRVFVIIAADINVAVCVRASFVLSERQRVGKHDRRNNKQHDNHDGYNHRRFAYRKDFRLLLLNRNRVFAVEYRKLVPDRGVFFNCFRNFSAFFDGVHACRIFRKRSVFLFSFHNFIRKNLMSLLYHYIHKNARNIA